VRDRDDVERERGARGLWVVLIPTTSHLTLVGKLLEGDDDN
jgi:hypothetical protein